MALLRRAILGLQVTALVAVLGNGCAGTPRHAHHFTPSPVQGTLVGEGLASWYGPGFHGRKTASGERFDQGDLTCAHRTLPFGTRVKITNLQNGQELVAVVNDRGPYVRRRILDVSKEVARQLDFIRQGTTRIRLETLPDEDAVSAIVADVSEEDPE